jgi:cell division protein FtsB
VQVDPSTSVYFGSLSRQMLNLWSTQYGIGVQASTLYNRTSPGGGFAWFQGGVHNNAQDNAGAGGTVMMTLDSSGNLRTTTGTIASLSDRNAKTDLQTVDAQEVLARVSALPVATWRYKTADPTQRHMGPMAQDFYAAFKVGLDDKSICTVDEGGVALAAIQGLNEKLESGKRKAETQMEQLAAENAELKQRLDALEKLILNQTPK